MILDSGVLPHTLKSIEKRILLKVFCFHQELESKSLFLRINAISASKAIELKDLALFVGTFILNLIPLYFLVPKTKIIKSN